MFRQCLKRTYYKIPYSYLKNTLILSINDFKSLVDLNPADKRNIIDKIFGFTEYNLMLKLLKEDIKMLDSSMSSNEGSLKTATVSIEKYEQQLEGVEEVMKFHRKRLMNWQKKIMKAKNWKQPTKRISKSWMMSERSWISRVREKIWTFEI